MQPTNGSAPANTALPMDLNRFADQINAHAQRPIEKDGILLYGSSFFANWGVERAARQLREASNGRLNAVNHGFGGATADELLYHYRRLVVPYQPRALIFRGGANDAMNGYSPEMAWALSQRVFEWAMKDFPGIQIGILCVFQYPSAKEALRPFFASYDAYAKAYALANGSVHFLDIHPFLYERAEDVGTYKGFRNLFLPDGLHLTFDAYEAFAPFFAELLAMQMGL